MFLNFFHLCKLPITSSASRKIIYFKSRKLLLWKTHQLSLRTTWKAGRNDSGRMVMRTKASLLKRVKSFQINYHYEYLKPGFVSHFQFIPLRNKLLSLVHFANGGLSYFITTQMHKLFTFFFFSRHQLFLKKYHINRTFDKLTNIKLLSFVSLLELVPTRGAQYCRSAGAFGKIIKFDYLNYTALIKLPSGSSKLFSQYSFATFGNVAFKEHRKFFNTKAGFWRSFGNKPIVRGVAMNPVDHPHGGRTNAIRYPRTPWGKTTKFK